MLRLSITKSHTACYHGSPALQLWSVCFLWPLFSDSFCGETRRCHAWEERMWLTLLLCYSCRRACSPSKGIRKQKRSFDSQDEELKSYLVTRLH